MTINNFIKEFKKIFGDDIEYKVTTKNNVIFKQTKGWKNDKIQFNQNEFTIFNKQIKRTKF